MTDFDNIINTLMFPTQFAKNFVNTGAGYPPYNIIKSSENETVLEVAVAGFKEDEVNVVVEDGYLKVSGKKLTNDDGVNYLYKGIGARSFERSFALSKDAKIDNAEYADGILSVFVSFQIPEEKKSKSIPIQRGGREYLAEKKSV